MDELYQKIEKFKATKPPLGSAHMHELLKEIFAAYRSIKVLYLPDDRRGLIGTLAMVERVADLYEKGEIDAIGKEISLYGIFAMI